MAKSHARLYDSAPLRDRVAAADVLLLVTPKLNRAVPGLVKDGVDWLGILREAAAAWISASRRRCRRPPVGSADHEAARAHGRAVRGRSARRTWMKTL
ncbi:NAD(P)H-dependent oxidoreductase [Actinomadura xylanilytica]|uniref:NAD(P)H-dependent oxidoreductase n=1 Tax=Actinomadura xylanilytica TaxID=887459 RepID=UPI003D80D122